MATPGRPISQADRSQIAKLRSNGLSIRQIAAARGISPTTVQKNLKTPIAK